MNFEVTELNRFLREELTISSQEITLVMQKQEELNRRSFEASSKRRPPDDYIAPIPMLLWQYGLVSRSGLERIFDWLETRY